jgi:hypothetical protein
MSDDPRDIQQALAEAAIEEAEQLAVVDLDDDGRDATPDEDEWREAS